MPDDKDIRWAGPGDEEEAGQDLSHTAGQDSESDREQKSWEAYRRWLQRGPEPRRSRGPLDPSLYTWKGYRNWAEEVKRNWSDRHRDDRDES